MKPELASSPRSSRLNCCARSWSEVIYSKDAACPANGKPAHGPENGTIDWGSLKGQSIMVRPSDARGQKPTDLARDTNSKTHFQCSRRASYCNRTPPSKAKRENSCWQYPLPRTIRSLAYQLFAYALDAVQKREFRNRSRWKMTGRNYKFIIEPIPFC